MHEGDLWPQRHECSTVSSRAEMYHLCSWKLASKGQGHAYIVEETVSSCWKAGRQ